MLYLVSWLEYQIATGFSQKTLQSSDSMFSSIFILGNTEVDCIYEKLKIFDRFFWGPQEANLVYLNFRFHSRTHLV